jgi:hypothetical protein
MPKLFEYLGLIVYFYSEEHDPIHVHGEYQGRESKAEIIIRDGEIAEIRLVRVTGKPPLEGVKLNDFATLVEHYAEEIVEMWVDYFVRHRQVTARKITRRIK